MAVRTSKRRYDKQRSRLYKAERTLPGFYATPSELASIEACQLYVNKILRKGWYKRNFGRRSVYVSSVRNNADATASYGSIRLPRWARGHMVILHELAHAVNSKADRHGPYFAGTYIYLVEQVLGEDRARELTEAFRAGGVDWTFTHIKNR